MQEPFWQGQKLHSIFWNGGEAITVGKNGCIDLEIVMENGQMAGVPWALATWREITNDAPYTKRVKFNLATAEGVRLLDVSK